MGCFTFEFHACFEALFESASWALLSGSDGDHTLAAPQTDIVLLILNCPLEKALARLAREYAVVKSRYLVAANRTWAAIIKNK